MGAEEKTKPARGKLAGFKKRFSKTKNTKNEYRNKITNAGRVTP